MRPPQRDGRVPSASWQDGGQLLPRPLGRRRKDDGGQFIGTVRAGRAVPLQSGGAGCWLVPAGIRVPHGCSSSSGCGDMRAQAGREHLSPARVLLKQAGTPGEGSVLQPGVPVLVLVKGQGQAQLGGDGELYGLSLLLQVSAGSWGGQVWLRAHVPPGPLTSL